MVDIQTPTAEIRRGKKEEERRNRTKLEMWANAQRDGRPAYYRWHSVQRRSLADAHY